ncbi:STP1 protein [Plasmodium ovale wallikeri]|uniref:STP1 protein n=1 Tax=Plasmodium ovale wallikeri TaxID=864142 RepID=A0A1A9AL83_PLAOA|nr:STP1 protein [Plasmodium ovale wallikeri]
MAGGADTITNDIKNLIRKYGHIDCGLRHEELCTELKKFINEKKTLELSVMDEKGKTKWNSEWSRKRNGFFSRLFEEEGFINMCYPPKKIGNSSLYQLKSKHIKFCKKRDEWKADVERNNEYNECVKYNQWVIAEIKSLTNEFLGNVKVSYLPTVKKYFRTKTQPEGYEPPDKYRNSRLDCTQYNPPQRSNPKGPAESYSVIKMAGDSGYTTLTHYIDIEVFLNWIQGYIRSLIRKYGHKKCGLMHVELCEEIKKIVNKKKTLILSPMDEEGKKKWNSEWRSQKNEFFNRLFQEEGFTYTCDSRKNTHNPSLYQLKSRHIQFCKDKDVRRAAVEANPEYKACREYDAWIETEKASFTSEYLRNVKEFRRPNVHKYFSTAEHPEGHDPLGTYRKSKLDCEIYNPNSKRYQAKLVEKAPAKSLPLPTASDPDPKSQGKGGGSILGKDGGGEKEKSDVKVPPKTELSSSNSQTSSLTNTKVDDTVNGQHDDLKANGTGPPNNTQDAGKPTEATDTQAKTPEQLPEPKISISHQDSLAANVPKTLPSVIKGQDTVSYSTASTTSATSDATHSTQNVAPRLPPDLSLVQPQSPAVAAVADQYSQEPTPPDPVRKSTDQDASLISALAPGLAPSQATASNSSASETSSTTTISTIGSSLDNDSHFPTLSTQPSVTTSVDTTVTQSVASVSGPPTITDAAMNKNPITSTIEIKSTTGEIGEPNSKHKTIPYSKYPNSASPKNRKDALPPDTGAQFPDAPSSAISSNLDDILLPVPSSSLPPGLPSGVSLGGQPSVLPASLNVVTRPDSNQIKTSPKDASQQSKDTNQVSSTSLPEGAQPDGKHSITSTKFPFLTNIIPTIIIILAAITLLFQLYKYTPFGFLLGRRRKRKKQDLKRILKTPQKPTYESPNIALHEWEDHNLLAQTVENDVYIKLLKINRYKQEMQKRKKENKKTLIEVHMEVFEEYKNDEWELHKGDFLEICLRGFINEDNDNYQNFPNSKLTINNINEKTIEDIQKQEILWNNWIEDHRNILEQWKKEEWFHILKNKWIKPCNHVDILIPDNVSGGRVYRTSRTLPSQLSSASLLPTIYEDDEDRYGWCFYHTLFLCQTSLI